MKHVQGDLKQEGFNWAHSSIVRRCGGEAKAWWQEQPSALTSQARECTGDRRGFCWSLWVCPFDTLPPPRPYVPVLHQQVHQLGPKPWNTWTYGGCSHSNHSCLLPSLCFSYLGSLAEPRVCWFRGVQLASLPPGSPVSVSRIAGGHHAYLVSRNSSIQARVASFEQSSQLQTWSF